MPSTPTEPITIASYRNTPANFRTNSDPQLHFKFSPDSSSKSENAIVSLSSLSGGRSARSDKLEFPVAATEHDLEVELKHIIQLFPGIYVDMVILTKSE